MSQEKKTRLHSLDEHTLAAIVKRFKWDDYLVMKDQDLIAALDGSHPLSHVEWSALLDSPLTLRRMMNLSKKIRMQADRNTKPAANDDAWQASPSFLRAADSGTDNSPLRTEDGWWSLSFPRTHDSWRLVLRLDKDAPFWTMLTESRLSDGVNLQIAVVDAEGRTLALGSLDEEGELFADWNLREDPRVKLKLAGGFEVVLV